MTDDRAPELSADYFGMEYNRNHEDVLTWQEEMVWRGWRLEADGTFGSQSDSVCRRFQSLKSLAVDGLVGPDTWSATWNEQIDAQELVTQGKTGE